ncbi:PREDICTED: LOW QUALITY PROTEIN: E3 ubiquitin-protein ligase LRSAM1-like [Polistes canadensis]|uniref:LOW QUALITY PROTEIN: E3 ubiquitin-protein ligase LRSAM1-like n=1 Tax=Polistes canadensis TaxID=91411 RepID=UPI000718DAC3|nr:PREDICTED: LOW QUALITY PROTEIN: E3 ubiquitin-protein ligase LRSAM1-like [Polistes canadensis]
MINVTRELLEQYYGFNNESNNDRYLSIHKSVNNKDAYEKENIDEQMILNETEEILTKEDVQSEKKYNEEESTDLCRHNLSELDEEEEKVDKSITLESINNCIKLDKVLLLNNFLNIKYVLIFVFTRAQDPEVLRTSELCPVSADDLDSTSDISSVITQDATQESNKQYEDLVPISNKKFVYNSMFVDLSNARLTVLPDNITQHFSTIQMLYLENNALSEIPDELFPSLQNLEWLDVRNNQLKSLPKNIKFHSSLHTLLLQGNQIQMLPLELCLIPRLKNLQVACNPLTMPPENVVALGCSSILTFLKIEWNKLHPDEIEIGVTYETCASKGIDFVRQKQLLWINKITEMLNKEASVLQKMKDKIALQKWRDDKSSFHKSMEKATKRREGDIPFATEDVNDLYITNAENNSVRYFTKICSLQSRIKLYNMNKKIIELLDSLNTINMDGITNMTLRKMIPSLYKNRLQVRLLQKEIHHLQRYNISMS